MTLQEQQEENIHQTMEQGKTSSFGKSGLFHWIKNPFETTTTPPTQTPSPTPTSTSTSVTTTLYPLKKNHSHPLYSPTTTPSSLVSNSLDQPRPSRLGLGATPQQTLEFHLQLENTLRAKFLKKRNLKWNTKEALELHQEKLLTSSMELNEGEEEESKTKCVGSMRWGGTTSWTHEAKEEEECMDKEKKKIENTQILGEKERTVTEHRANRKGGWVSSGLEISKKKKKKKKKKNNNNNKHVKPTNGEGCMNSHGSMAGVSSSSGPSL
ncbi:hypothetical protein HMI54_002754 [Coelomomyces lativittatus]|nr:hypothetical protein HMI54_002754 [Coelomomyces lativittatus]